MWQDNDKPYKGTRPADLTAMSAAREAVVMIIANHLGRNESEIKDGNAFDEDLGADSLDQIGLVMALEQEFEIEISDAEADQADTVGKLVALVERLVAK